MSPSEWSRLMPEQKLWEGDREIFTTGRSNTAIPQGDTVFFDVSLTAGWDTVIFKLRIIGEATGTHLDYSASAPGVTDSWYSDGDFHEALTVLNGRSVTLKYKPMNDDMTDSRDILYVLHDLPVYVVDAADYGNPNVFNVMSYNVQMIPFGISGLGQAALRGDLLPVQISPHQDVVIFQEVFDDGPRENNLEPAMLAAGFTYKTSILNAPPPGVLIPGNGGVMIFSRWPIEFTAEYEFDTCGQAANDCLARKGIKYARINKLGKKYHVFGTHMDAGQQPDDLFAKRLSFKEMREFIEIQQIPPDEAVIYGGDFNVSPLSSDNLFISMLDSLNPVIPPSIGFANSTFSGDSGKIIDNIWACRKHLIPIEATNEIITIRSIDDALWEFSEFSDHRTALGRFVYPDIKMSGDRIEYCVGQQALLSVETEAAMSYQWLQDGVSIHGAISNELSLSSITIADVGSYQCQVLYQVVYGNDSRPLTQFFYPFGPDTVRMEVMHEVAIIKPVCEVGITDKEKSSFEISPNPSSDFFMVNAGSDDETNLTIISAQGSIVYSERLAKGRNRISTAWLNKGLYFVQIRTSNSTGVTKILVQ